MLTHPPVMALVLASSLAALVLTVSTLFSWRLLRDWDPASGSERQIGLEKTTALVSTMVAFVLIVEVVGLVLFVATLDRLSALFVGAMCAVGTLNASVWGFPALFGKIAVFFAASLWLVIDHVDNRGRDYPYIRQKYAALFVLTPLVLVTAGIQAAYFLDLKADTITSCCGKLFGEETDSTGGDLAALDPRLALWLLYGGMVLVLAYGWLAQGSRRLLTGYGLASLALFVLALAAVVSAISIYVYEHPHHHCPFCLLKREYAHFGFVLYPPLFIGAAAGMATSVLALLPARASMAAVMPVSLARLTRISLGGFVLFGLIAGLAVAFSGLRLD